MRDFQSSRISRRSFLASAPAVLMLGPGKRQRPQSRPKIAALVTEYRKYSHGEHIVDRFLEGYGWEGQHHHPPMDLVSLYVDQVKDNDLSRERAGRFPSMKIYPNIAKALTLGGSELAVDGVLLIGEHGNYPTNEKGQKLYPRYEFFKQIVEVFRRSRRSVPVFNDKHLSWKWEWAREMVDTARELDFAFMAGSSVPVFWRLPPIEIPLGADVDEVMVIGAGGGADGYGIHGFEGMQCMVERRRGGETGVAALQALRGNKVWEALRAGSWAAGGWDPELFEACLCRSHMLTPARQGFNHIYPTLDQIPLLVKEELTPVGPQLGQPLLFRCEYADGLKATLLMLEGLVMGWHFAARLKGSRELLSTQMYGPGRGGGAGPEANFFNPFVNNIEKMFLTGKATYPVERTLLTTGMTAAAVESLWQGQKRIETPHLAVQYRPSKESHFWRT
ncbi:MAG: hypothetical protein EXQ58_03305 [Acidobacteria bacterium]|nr:hypothetical protein [Acidobacteriota bacterium]